MKYYEIEVKESFIHSYKLHVKKLEEVLPNYAIKLANVVGKKFKLIQLFP